MQYAWCCLFVELSQFFKPGPGNIQRHVTGLGLTSPMQLLTGDYIAQDVSIGFTRFFPAELQRIRAQRCEDQGSWCTGSAQSERRALEETAQ